MVDCCCGIVNTIFKRLCSDGPISQAGALGPLVRSVVQSVLQAAAHIPSEIRDAPRPTKDGNFDLPGARWFARDQANHTKVVQLIQQHVGPQDRVVAGETSIFLLAMIRRMLLTLWYTEKCWSNKIGLTNKEAESYRWAVVQFANDWRALQWQHTVWVHWTCVHSGSFAAEYRIFYIFSTICTERRNVEFKMDIRHSFLGYKILRPYFSSRAFTHVLELNALNVGLQMWHALHDTKDKKRRMGRQQA